MKHDFIEKRIGLMGVLVAVVVSLGGLAELVPLMLSPTVNEPTPPSMVSSRTTACARCMASCTS